MDLARSAVRFPGTGCRESLIRFASVSRFHSLMRNARVNPVGATLGLAVRWSSPSPHDFGVYNLVLKSLNGLALFLTGVLIDLSKFSCACWTA
jgi:hypothetical protein